MVVLNYLYTNFHRFYWYERLVSDTKIPSYLFMEQFEHMLEYYLTCDTSPFFGELFEMVHANDIAQLRSKMGVINQMFTKFNLLTHAHFSTLSEDKVKITLSFYRALFTSAKTIVEQYDQQQKLAAIQSQKP
jgi:hypothetical protein